MKTSKVPGVARGTLAGLVALLAMAGASAAPLAGSEWWPTEVEGEARPGTGESFVRFESDGKVAGHGGCNRFFGSYDTSGDQLQIGALGATRRACAGATGEDEQRFLGALQKTHRYERDGIELTLFDESGAVLMRLRQSDAD
jgi:heat shock protein HslJ